MIYREKKSGKYYGKRSSIGGFILEKEYRWAPEGCQLELLTPRPDAIYTMTETDGRGREKNSELNLMELPLRSPKARGMLLTAKQSRFTHARWLTPEELAVFAQTTEEEVADEEEESVENTAPEPTPAPEPVKEPEAAPAPEPVKEPEAAPEPEPVEEPEPTPAPEKKPKAKTKKSAPVEVPEPTPAPEPVEEPEIEAEEKPEPAPEPEPVEEPKPEVVEEPKAEVEEKPEPAQEPVQEPEPVPEPETEAAPDLVLDDDGEPVKKARRSVAKPSKPEKPAPEPADDEDFGIVQPEFGF